MQLSSKVNGGGFVWQRGSQIVVLRGSQILCEHRSSRTGWLYVVCEGKTGTEDSARGHFKRGRVSFYLVYFWIKALLPRVLRWLLVNAAVGLLGTCSVPSRSSEAGQFRLWGVSCRSWVASRAGQESMDYSPGNSGISNSLLFYPQKYSCFSRTK